MSTDTQPSGVVCGWRRDLTIWEHPELHLSEAADPRLPSGCLVFGDGLPAQIDESMAVEVEVVLESRHRHALEEFLKMFVSPNEITELIESCATIGREPISSNRDLELSSLLDSEGWKASDFSVSSLPSRRGDAQMPLYYGTRWGRIFRKRQTVITVYSEFVSGYWDFSMIRWPHFSIPSLPREWFIETPEGRDESEIVDGVIFSSLSNVLKHNVHFLDSWTIESELWEQEVFQYLIGPPQASWKSGFHDIESQLGRLADFLSHLRIGFRNLRRRADVSRLLKSVPGLSENLKLQAQNAEAQLDSDRAYLRSHLETMRALNDKAQTLNAEEQIRLSRKSDKLVSRVVALLLIPSLVVGVYGANVRELSTEDTRGSLLHLGIWLIATLVISFSVLGSVEGAGLLSQKIWKRVASYFSAMAILWALISIANRDDLLVPGIAASIAVLVSELRLALIRGNSESSPPQPGSNKKEKSV